MTVGFSAAPYRETAKDRVAGLQKRLELVKTIFGEVEADIEKCETKQWLNLKTLKRLDKAIVVMKVGYKIAKRGMNRDHEYGDPAAKDDPAITEADQARVAGAIAASLKDAPDGN